MTPTTELQYSNDYTLAFCENPMMIYLEMSSTEFPTNSSATQVVLRVHINGHDYEFSSEAVNGDVVSFDISSAWRAEYKRTPVKLTDTKYNVLEGTVYARTKYVANNSITITTNDEYQLYTHIFGLKGGITEADIELSGYTTPDEAVTKFKNSLTRKPNDVLLYNVGDTHRTSKLILTNINYVLAGTSNMSVNTTSTNLTASSSVSGVKVVNDNNRHEIAFVNSFGVIESVSCVMLESLGHKVNNTVTKTYSHGKYANSYGVMNNSTERYSSWSMSSGLLPYEWVYWFADEFLSAKQHWLRLSSGKYIPVQVKPKDTSITIYDKTKAVIEQVEFEVTSILKGRIDI